MHTSFSRLLLGVCFLFFTVSLQAQNNPKREFRATWLTTHCSIDWPKTKVKTSGDAEQIAAQKKELTAILDRLVEGNMNAFCIQVRPVADAFYKSSYEPWSRNLTGTRGKNPGYDPLAYAVEEGHKRGLEVHIWANPFRACASGSLSESDKVYKNCSEWLIKYNNGSFDGQIIDPGFPESRQYVVNVLMEAVNNYDIDGIIMDDYFYPYGGTTNEDAKSKSKYKPADMADGDWRRHNVDTTIHMLYDSIQAVKPWVRFGLGPFGIWTTNASVAKEYGIMLPQGISGSNAYNVLACNTVEWVKGGYVDYIAPQLYWPTTSAKQDYDVLCKWWSQDVCKHFSDLLPGNKRVDFFSSQAPYRYSVSEMELEIDDNRKFCQLAGSGSVFYNTKSYIYDNGRGVTNMHRSLAGSRFSGLALPPAMDWKQTEELEAPSDLRVEGKTLHWNHAKAERFTVYILPKEEAGEEALATGKYLKRVVYGKQLSLASAGDLKGKVIAVCAYDRFGCEFAPAYYDCALYVK